MPHHLQNIGPEMAVKMQGDANHSQVSLGDTDQKTDKMGQTILVQEDPSKCWKCQRKVGLLGFKCACKYTFCSRHRHAEDHACGFDYKAAYQAKLTKEMVKCEAEKVAKI